MVQDSFNHHPCEELLKKPKLQDPPPRDLVGRRLSGRPGVAVKESLEVRN